MTLYCRHSETVLKLCVCLLFNGFRGIIFISGTLCVCLQLTHGVMNKELKSCKNPEDLECNENVKHKTKEYIKKYMQKFGAVYRPKEDTEME